MFGNYEIEEEVMNWLNRDFWSEFRVQVKWNFDEKIVIANDEIVEVTELNFLKGDLELERAKIDDANKLVRILTDGMAAKGFRFIRLDKDVWLSNDIRYRLFFKMEDN